MGSLGRPLSAERESVGDSSSLYRALEASAEACVSLQAASGAAELLPFVQVTNLVRTLDRLRDRGIWVLGAAGEDRVVDDGLSDDEEPPASKKRGSNAGGFRPSKKQLR